MQAWSAISNRRRSKMRIRNCWKNLKNTKTKRLWTKSTKNTQVGLRRWKTFIKGQSWLTRRAKKLTQTLTWILLMPFYGITAWTCARGLFSTECSNKKWRIERRILTDFLRRWMKNTNPLHHTPNRTLKWSKLTSTCTKNIWHSSSRTTISSALWVKFLPKLTLKILSRRLQSMHQYSNSIPSSISWRILKSSHR